MTALSSIITAAYRDSELVTIFSTPTSAEIAEALERLLSIIASVIGFDAGQELVDLNIGGVNDQSARVEQYVPANKRLILNLSAAKTLKLDPNPYDGQRVAIVDAGSSLDTYSLTLDGNGRLIEGATTVVIVTADTVAEWFYRADLGNWVPIVTLEAEDDLPFPEAFDDYFIARLAMRLNPRHSAETPQETLIALRRAEGQLRARYRRPRPMQDMGTLGLFGRSGLQIGQSDLLEP